MDIIEKRAVYLGKLANIIGWVFLVLMMIRYALIANNIVKCDHVLKQGIYYYIAENIIAVVCLILAIVPEALMLAYIYCISKYTNLLAFKEGDITIKDIKSLVDISDI